ncbi:CoA pyrophosphatase [Streptococcus gallolyticus]|uniref:NUDIX hydrolase n=1 Tax=Streptococcus hepaticus TaxID=3349163 RepID=UPI001C944543|nr:CoA pyrophosphatase [Streptococcus gallolyticus]MBY5040932.1 CoA pyrophosphatase [Streptococcus gallolyticus]
MKDKKTFFQEYQAQPLGQEKVYAVFLPLVWANDEWQILYELRSQTISQPGEVSFPGGRVEVGESYQAAAIRETMEELNVAATDIDIWGEIDYIVYHNRTIRCFVGQLKIDDWTDICPNAEVERLFTVPLKLLQATPPVYHRLEATINAQSDFPFERITDGAGYKFSHHNRLIPFYEEVSENIWGMTAQLTHRFIILWGQEAE